MHRGGKGISGSDLASDGRGTLRSHQSLPGSSHTVTAVCARAGCSQLPGVLLLSLPPSWEEEGAGDPPPPSPGLAEELLSSDPLLPAHVPPGGPETFVGGGKERG